MSSQRRIIGNVERNLPPKIIPETLKQLATEQLLELIVLQENTVEQLIPIHYEATLNIG